MKFFAPIAMAGVAAAAPLSARELGDADILQFALTLEHLENVFYKKALATFSEKKFADAHFDSFYYRNLQFIGADEQSHVDYLTAGLKAAGAKPVAACEYNFQFTDVKSFLGLSAVLEGVGVSAYLGAAPAIKNKAYLTAAGSILVTEAKHQSLQRYVTGKIAPDNAYGTPLDPNPVYTLAASFIKSCPSSNAPLPFKAFPALQAEIGSLPQVGQTHITEFSTKATNTPNTAYLTFINGLSITSVKTTKKANGRYDAAVPANNEGQTYVILTSVDTKGKSPMDSEVVAGPAILEVCSNIQTTSPGYPNGPN